VSAGDRNVRTLEKPASLEPPLPGDQSALWRDNHRVQQTDLDLVDIHQRLISTTLEAGPRIAPLPARPD
jgi:hypothetical protein